MVGAITTIQTDLEKFQYPTVGLLAKVPSTESSQKIQNCLGILKFILLKGDEETPLVFLAPVI